MHIFDRWCLIGVFFFIEIAMWNKNQDKFTNNGHLFSSDVLPPPKKTEWKSNYGLFKPLV